MTGVPYIINETWYLRAPAFETRQYRVCRHPSLFNNERDSRWWRSDGTQVSDCMEATKFTATVAACDTLDRQLRDFASRDHRTCDMLAAPASWKLHEYVPHVTYVKDLMRTRPDVDQRLLMDWVIFFLQFAV